MMMNGVVVKLSGRKRFMVILPRTNSSQGVLPTTTFLSLKVCLSVGMHVQYYYENKASVIFVSLKQKYDCSEKVTDRHESSFSRPLIFVVPSTVRALFMPRVLLDEFKCGFYCRLRQLTMQVLV